MNVQKTILSAALTGALALGMSGQAAAEIYAGGRLTLQDLTITFTPTAGAINPGAVTGFTFVTAANATLNGSSGNDNDTCGTVAGPACSATAPVLQSTANAPGGAPVRAAGDFNFFGPGVGQTYSNSASQIGEAQLSTGNPTSTNQISEVELAGAGAGNSDTKVTSTTALNFVFTIPDVGGVPTTTDFVIAFKADPDLFTKVNTPGLTSDAAQASVSFSLNLTSTNGTQISWAPDGVLSAVSPANCTGPAGVACTENTDSESLNLTRILPPGNPAQNGYSDNRNLALSDLGLQDYKFTVTGLPAGTYSLGLSETTAAEAQQKVVPEPGTMSLLGLSLMGLGFARRRFRA